MVKTKTIKFTGFDKLPAGQNAIGAVMSFSGYDLEDAIIVSKFSMDCGFGRCHAYCKQTCSMKCYSNQTFDRIMGPSRDSQSGDVIWHHKVLDNDELCCPGEQVQSKLVLVNKSVPIVTQTIQSTKTGTGIVYKDQPVTCKGPTDAYVDKVMVSANTDDEMLIKVLMRSTQCPELGGKFSSHHGQKGVCGLIVDLPLMNRECLRTSS